MENLNFILQLVREFRVYPMRIYCFLRTVESLVPTPPWDNMEIIIDIKSIISTYKYLFT